MKIKKSILIGNTEHFETMNKKWNICGENRHLRQARKRYLQCYETRYELLSQQEIF
jgi:hypothetical protein